MKRLLSRMGLVGVFIMTAVVGQVFFASSVYAAENPTFVWEDSYTAGEKLGEKQLTWCSSNMDGETVADLAKFRTDSGFIFMKDCLDSNKGGICRTVEKGADQEYRCFRTIPDDHPLVLAIKSAEANEVNPVQVLYCGAANNPTQADNTLNDCYQAVRNAYFSPKCYYANQKDSKLGRSSSRDEASCVHDALRNNDNIIKKGISNAQVLSEARKGRKAANIKIRAAIAGDIAQLQCIDDGGKWTDGACAEGSGGSNEQVCSAGMLGWVICPLAEGMVSIIEQVAEILQGLLIYQPLIGSDQGNSIKAIWNLLLVIANLGLVIAILIIVFSQATSVGLSNYGIKKLLPRVFAAAILMNLSFYLCAIAVDLSNIMGVSVKAIVEAGMDQLAAVNGAGNSGVEYGAGLAQHFTVGVVGLMAAAVAIGTGAIWLLLPVLVSAAMAIVTALLILAARQVLITLLIIISPLAILAWILPNTDEWFTKWRKLFTVLLMLFPIIMAVFYGSILVSAVILSAGADTGNGLNDFTIKLLAFLVLIVPLFSLPFIMKAAGGILDRFGVLVNNKNKGLVDRSRKFADERKGNTSYQRGRGIRRTAKQDFRNKRFAERLNLSNKSLADFKAENGGSLTATQMAQWSRAQQTKGLAGGAGEIARMTGRGAMKGVAKIPGSPESLSGSVRDTALLGSAYAAGAVGKIPGGDMRRAQTEALNRGAQAQEAKAFAERVSAIQTNYDRGGSAGADASAGGYLDKQFQEAILTRNHEQAAAVINRLSGLGAGGRNRLSSVLQDNVVTDTKLQDTIVKSVFQDNYSSLVDSRADTAKANGYSSTGAWDNSGALGKVGTAQLAKQDEKSLYQNFGDISVAEATKIMTEPNLESTVQNAKARAILNARRTGATSLPASGPINPLDPALGDWKDLAK